MRPAPAQLGELASFGMWDARFLSRIHHPFAIFTSSKAKTFVNTVMTLGTYMIMHCNKNLQATTRCRAPFLHETNDPARQHDPNLDLRVED